MKCSSLNNHLYMRNIVNSPLCRCGNIETNSHFKFKCPFYTDARLSLKTTVDSLNATVDDPTLLYGNCLQWTAFTFTAILFPKLNSCNLFFYQIFLLNYIDHIICLLSKVILNILHHMSS